MNLPVEVLPILLFEGVTFLLLAAVFLCRRFFVQPIDRIRLTQIGFALVAVLAVCLAGGVMPAWTIPLMETAESRPQTADGRENTSHQNVFPEEQRALRSTDSPSLLRPYPLMTQEDTEIRTHHAEPPLRLRAHQPAENLPVEQKHPSAVLNETATTSVESQMSTKTAVHRLLPAVCRLLSAVFLLPPLVLFVRELSAWRCLDRIRRRAVSPPEQVVRLFDRTRGPSRRKVALKISGDITTPIIFGVFRTTLLIPSGDTVPGSRKLRACLVHEWSHLKSGDLATWNIVRWFQYILWMQPFYWMLRRRLLADQDFLADADAAADCDDATEYAAILHGLAGHRVQNTVPGTVLGMAPRKSQLRRRIDMLLSNVKPARTSSKRQLSLLLTLLTALTLLGGSLRLSETADGRQQTVAKEKKEQKEPGMERSAIPEQEPGITVELADADGKPCTTGYIRTYPNPRPADWEGDQPRNFDLADGKAFVPISNFREQKTFKIVLYPDGFAPYELRWLDTAKEPLPTKLSFKMPERAAQPIGGRIVNENGEPVEGAIVQFGVSILGRANHPDGFISTYAQWIKTDADGYWIYQVLPTEQFEQDFDLSIEHATYPRLRFESGQKFKDFAAKDADGKFSKIIMMPMGRPLKGKIVDEQGNPVAGAIVHCNAAWRDPDKPYGHEGTKTDANGEFLFERCSPKGELRTVDIGICHNDFAPEIVSLSEITPDMKPMNIVLKKGKKIVLKAVDQDDMPLEGIRISSRYWKSFWGPATGTHQLFVDADDYGAVKTGKDGRFLWENAPDNRFDLIMEDGNRRNVKIDYETLKYGDEENVFVFKPLIDVTGTVTDAETGEPIPGFSVTEWFSFKGHGGGLTREFGSQPASDGKFTRTVGHRFGEFDDYYLRVEADGYEGLQSEDLIAKTGATALEFQLKKATGEFTTHLTGTILQPDGNPAANTEIGIATAAQSIQTKGLTLYRHPAYERQYFKTDHAGKFSISRSGGGQMSIGDQDYKLIFLHDTGTILMTKEEFESHTGPITLQAWSRIEGTVRVGSKPLPNAPVYWNYQERISYAPGKAHVGVVCEDNLKANADGYYSIRVFPGKGYVGRLTAYNNSTTMATSLAQPFDIKPGETLTIDIGGGGYFVKGQVHLPTHDMPNPVDWRFAHVEASPSMPEYTAMPPLSGAAMKLSAELAQAMPEELRRYSPPNEMKALYDRWLETPEAKAIFEKNQEALEEWKQYTELASKHMVYRDYSRERRSIGVMDDQGQFQLDDLTPGNWTLEITLNFPSVPLQWWDYADVWRKKIDVTIPDFSADYKDETLQIPAIIFGYDKSERKGPER